VLGAHSSKRRKFQTEDIHFLESVAHILAAAIERRKSEGAIRKSESWLRSLVATTQDAVVSIDRRGCVALFNQGAQRIFGYSAEELVGRKVNVLMAEPYAAEHDGYIARYETTGEAHAIGRIRTVTARRKDGTLFPIELSVTEIEVDEDVHYAAFIRDISEKTRLQQQLVESEKLAAIGGTAAKIGHEIANPLNGIYLTLQLVEQRLGKQPSDDPRVAADIVKIKKEIARLNQLVQEFRTLSRQQDYHFRLTDVGALIADILDIQQPLCESNGILVRCAIAADVPAARVDEDKIKQALLNVIKNAGEAMPKGGTLSVAVRGADDTVLIEISDTGGGIPADTDVFAPFFTTKKEGTGLGLIIVRQIVSAHGGAIFYDSQPGKGTTFHIMLPRDPSAGLRQ
jgi:two-component system sensor kinase FixL